MSGGPFLGAEPFCYQQSIFGAVDVQSERLVLVVEATTFEQARVHINAVSPLRGAVPGTLEVIALESLPDGVPVFLKGFFEAGKIGFNRSEVAPSSSTLQ